MVAIHTFGAGVHDNISFYNRVNSTALTYLFLGKMFCAGRDYTRKNFIQKENEKLSPAVEVFHNSAYGGMFNLLVTPPLLLMSGETNLTKIALASAFSAGVGTFTGAMVGYYNKYILKESLGWQAKERERVPALLRKMDRKTKRKTAISLTLASIALNLGIYGFTPDTTPFTEWPYNKHHQLADSKEKTKESKDYAISLENKAEANN